MFDTNKARLVEATLESGLEALPKARRTTSTNPPMKQQELSEPEFPEQDPIARKSFLQEITPDPG